MMTTNAFIVYRQIYQFVISERVWGFIGRGGGIINEYLQRR